MNTISLNSVTENNLQLEEIYKSLRANVQFSGKEVKTIVFTSCIPNEGKSTVVVELGISLAQAGKKTLIIDADLRKSVLASRHKTERNTKGLSQLLSGNSTIEETLNKTNIPNLHLILSGPFPPNPAELLGSETMKNLLKSARSAYDYVLIDMAPLGSVIDAAVVAPMVDGVVMVVCSGEIKYRFAQDVKELLERANAHILGVVLNKVDQGRYSAYASYGGYYGKYYGKYYGSYYGSGSSKDGKKHHKRSFLQRLFRKKHHHHSSKSAK